MKAKLPSTSQDIHLPVSGRCYLTNGKNRWRRQTTNRWGQRQRKTNRGQEMAEKQSSKEKDRLRLTRKPNRRKRDKPLSAEESRRKHKKPRLFGMQQQDHQLTPPLSDVERRSRTPTRDVPHRSNNSGHGQWPAREDG